MCVLIEMLAQISRWLFVDKRFYSSKLLGNKRIRSKMDINLKCREDPVVLKLDTPEFKNIFTQEVHDLKNLFDKYQYEIRIAGGAVRDLLMGQEPKDLDFATVATPQQMKEMFTVENVRMINMSGEKHGTITPRINDKENFEVTTLRVDMVTDGRHAEVEFTTDWKMDSNRRDLTINSMFLGFDGSVYDYFYGYEDIQKRRVAFVGDPDVRIKEDYLRILRYFRFYGRIAESPNNHEDVTLKVIRQNAAGLKNVSGERIYVELKKILQGNFSGELLKCMLSLEMGQHMGLPVNPNVEELNNLLIRSSDLSLHPLTMLASILKDMNEVVDLHARLKFSVYERELIYFIVQHREQLLLDRSLIELKKLVHSTYKQKMNVTIEYVTELLKYNGDKKLLQEFSEWEIPVFPIDGKILKQNGVPPGFMLGHVMKALKAIWIENNYNQSSEELVKLIPNILEEIKANKKKVD